MRSDPPPVLLLRRAADRNMTASTLRPPEGE